MPTIVKPTGRCGGMRDFVVSLNSATPDGVWLPGSRLSGQLRFHVEHSTRIRCMRIKCDGRELVQVKIGRETVKGRAVPFKDVRTVYGPSNPEADRTDAINTVEEENVWTTLAVGAYCVAFAFRLPERLSPSCAAQNGGAQSASVLYRVKAYTDICSRRSRDLTSVVAFNVVVPMTALQVHFLQNDANWGRSKITAIPRVGCSRCCSKGHVEVQIRCANHVALMSENTPLDITAELLNKSSSVLSSLVISLRNRLVVRTKQTSSSMRLIESTVLQSAMILDVPPGGACQISTAFELRPFSNSFPPSMVSRLLRSKWFIVVHFNDDVDEGCYMPIVVASSVDKENILLPIDLVEPEGS